MSFNEYAPQDFPDDITPDEIAPNTPSPNDTVRGIEAARDEEPPPTPNYQLRPRARQILLAFFVHHNPFYLLSALCMIVGCYVLNAGLELRTGEVHRILILIGTLSLYELMLVALGLFLIRSRGVLRDGRTLLLLQIVFLVDLTFLNAETVTVDLRTGIAVNVVLLVLALIKVGAVMKWLTPTFPWREYAMAGLMLTALFGLPCALKLIEHDGRIEGTHFHAIWWCVGLLPVLCEALRHIGRGKAEEQATAMRPRLAALYVTIGYLSVIAHLGMMHWVYRGRFYAADLTPALLGLAAAAAYGSPTRLIPASDLRFARFWLPPAAILCAVTGPRPIDLAIGLDGRFDLTSFHLAVLGAIAVYFYAYFWRWIRIVATVGAATATLLLVGPTLQQIQDAGTVATNKTLNFAWSVMPKTMLHWGMTAIGAAFVFLGLGAALSLRHPVSRDPTGSAGTADGTTADTA